MKLKKLTKYTLIAVIATQLLQTTKAEKRRETQKNNNSYTKTVNNKTGQSKFSINTNKLKKTITSQKSINLILFISGQLFSYIHTKKGISSESLLPTIIYAISCVAAFNLLFLIVEKHLKLPGLITGTTCFIGYETTLLIMNKLGLKLGLPIAFGTILILVNYCLNIADRLREKTMS